MLYITLGQPFNVPPRDRLELHDRAGIGGIIRLDPFDGSNREVYARGIRNSVGLDFNPKDNTLWFTDNQTDGMGDDIPPGVINRATRPGQHFGYPWLGGHKVRITEHGYDKDKLPEGVVGPQVETVAHGADLGMTFYTGRMFPKKYHGGIFNAQHGSWNQSSRSARLMVTSLKPDGTADKHEVFAEGWLDEETGTYRGRPVDVAVMKDGSLLVSDDFAGAIYRITYSGQWAPRAGAPHETAPPASGARRRLRRRLRGGGRRRRRGGRAHEGAGLRHVPRAARHQPDARDAASGRATRGLRRGTAARVPLGAAPPRADERRREAAERCRHRRSRGLVRIDRGEHERAGALSDLRVRAAAPQGALIINYEPPAGSASAARSCRSRGTQTVRFSATRASVTSTP